MLFVERSASLSQEAEEKLRKVILLPVCVLALGKALLHGLAVLVGHAHCYDFTGGQPCWHIR